MYVLQSNLRVKQRHFVEYCIRQTSCKIGGRYWSLCYRWSGAICVAQFRSWRWCVVTQDS